MKEINATKKPRKNNDGDAVVDEMIKLLKDSDEHTSPEREEQAMAQAIEKLTKTDVETTKILSEISIHESHPLLKMRVLNDVFEKEECGIIHSLDIIPQEYLKLKISKNRKGRTEIVDIAKSKREEQMNRASRLKGLFGSRGDM